MFKRLFVSQRMRQRVSWIIAAVLILPFLLFFHATGQNPVRGAGGIAGMLSGKPVPWDTYQTQQRWVRRQLESQFKGVPADMLRAFLDRQTWDRLMLLDEAHRRMLRVDDGAVASFIQRAPAFQEAGRFKPERYYQYVRMLGESPQTFERLLHDDLLIEQLMNTVKSGTAVTEDDVRHAYTKEHEQLTATLILFDPSSFTSTVEGSITDEALHAEYDAHPEAVRTPEQVRIEAAGRSQNEVTATIHPTEEQLRAYYQEHHDDFLKPDKTAEAFEAVRDTVTRQVVDEQAHKQLSNLALDLQDDLDAGVRFEEFVAARGLTSRTFGPLDAGNTLASGGPEPAVLQAIKDLPEGRLSSVIDTGHGVYVARVLERMPPRLPPFDDVKATIRSRLVEERAKSAAKTAAETWRTAWHTTPEHDARMEESALKAGAARVWSSTFTRTGSIDQLGTVNAVNEAVFGIPLGSLTQTLETPQGSVIARPDQHLDADQSAFAQAKDNLRQQLVDQKQSEHIQNWLQELRTRAKLENFIKPESPSH